MTARRLRSPRARAVSVLRDVLENAARATVSIAQHGEGLSSEDGRLLREIALGVLRWKSALDAELASACRVPLSRLAPNLREILEVALYQIRHLDRVPHYAAVDEAVRHARDRAGAGAGGLVNAVLRSLLRASPSGPSAEAVRGGSGAARSLAQRFSHPEFLIARWIERFGEEATLAILEADNTPSPLDLMINSRKTDRETLAAALAEEKIQTCPWAFSPLALTVTGGQPVRSPLFAAGHFSIQDVGSQILPLLLPPGDTLVDLAAAPGGKTFAALALGRARRAVALDRSAERMRLFVENASRLGFREAWPAVADAAAPPLAPGRFDRVLYDAPCSGTGTLRKNPEIRYRLSPEAIDRLSRAQSNGVLSGARLLASGGYLLFATCSLEREENEAVVDDVLAADPSLELAPIEPAAGLEPFLAGGRFRMLPGPVQDGFTAHLLRKR